MRSILSSIKFLCLSILLLVFFSFKCGSSTAHRLSTNASLTSILSEKQFSTLFPQRNQFYSYSAFVRAVREMALIKVKVARRALSVYQFTRTDRRNGKTVIIRQDPDWDEAWAKVKRDSVYTIDYADFCADKNSEASKRELAAFFAHIAHETRHGQNGQYTDGLMLIHETNTSLPYIAENDTYPPATGQKYYGRGPMQLSYNGNYGYASDCIFGDKKILLNNPGLVETNAVVAFKTAIYFWMTPQTHKPSAHDVMVGKWQPNTADKAAGRTRGFGMTIDIVNGEVECYKGESMFSMNDRIGFYKYFLGKFGISDNNCACSCAKMKPY